MLTQSKDNGNLNNNVHMDTTVKTTATVNSSIHVLHIDIIDCSCGRFAANLRQVHPQTAKSTSNRKQHSEEGTAIPDLQYYYSVIAPPSGQQIKQIVEASLHDHVHCRTTLE